MKKTTKMAALLLASVMVFAACSNNDSVSESSLEETTTTVSETTMEETTTETTEEEVAETTVTFEELELDYSGISITSQNLNDGVWDSRITFTENGENISPELSWEEVEGAAVYAIYMIDLDAQWLHMIAMTTETSIPEGFADGENGNQYIGPYPPSGTHNYAVYVIALRNYPTSFSTLLDSGNKRIERIAGRLDLDSEGNFGNIIAAGMISGTYTRGE